MNNVEYLILSSSIDFSSDLVCLELEKRRKSYLRINRDFFAEYKIVYDLNKEEMTISIGTDAYQIRNNTLKSIFFRAPVFIRAYGKKYDLNTQVYRSQWSSFIRNLVVFNNAKWINHPVSTYRAENKLFQLKCAKDIGLLIPETYVSNCLPDKLCDDRYVVKALDTPLFYDDGDELFTYTTVLSREEMRSASFAMAPVFIQEYVSPKIDLRVTIVGEKVYPVQILKNGLGIDGDWRKTKKEDLQYIACALPNEIEQKLLDLMKKLDLQFGGVDLILSNNRYYFIEVNPTGEWSWLVSPTGFRIDQEIVNCMEVDIDEMYE